MLTGMTIVAIVSGVRHNASELASALTGETILQRKRLPDYKTHINTSSTYIPLEPHLYN